MTTSSPTVRHSSCAGSTLMGVRATSASAEDSRVIGLRLVRTALREVGERAEVVHARSLVRCFGGRDDLHRVLGGHRDLSLFWTCCRSDSSWAAYPLYAA